MVGPAFRGYTPPAIRSVDMFRAIVLSCLVLAAQGAFGAAAAQPAGQAAAPPPVAAPAEGVGSPTALSPEEALTYRLGPGDKLYIITFDETQLTGNFFVGANGMVSFPWIGDVPAVGRTESQLREDIEARLRDGYIKNPQVSVQVLVFRPFYILGEVNKPGEYPYVSGLTVMSAVATAQGFTYRANKHTVWIKRPGQSAEVKLRLTPATEVHAGDTVRIAERYF
jgi:polysaccharide export outer membrane protein